MKDLVSKKDWYKRCEIIDETWIRITSVNLENIQIKDKDTLIINIY